VTPAALSDVRALPRVILVHCEI